MKQMKGVLTRCNPVVRMVNCHAFRFNLAHGVMAVEIKNTIGIGARLSWVLEILAFCDENELLPKFRFTYPDSKNDYFSRFFRIATKYTSIDKPCKYVKIYTIGQLGLGKNYDRELTIPSASYLIDKYLRIQDDIQQEVDRFCTKYFAHISVLGVHYRGTDKAAEAPVVPYKKVEDNIRLFLKKFPETQRVFVSSDDDVFMERIKRSSFGELVLIRNDSYRSNSTEAIHLSATNKYDINRDAVVNCLLLARCQALLKSSSLLSAWSVLFNPGIPLVLLNSSFERYFPERDFAEFVLYDAL